MSRNDFSKEEIHKAVLNTALNLDIRYGHLKWNYTILSKESEVSRSLIYYYFGKDKINILKEACFLFGDELSGKGKERTQAWENGRVDIGLNKTRDLLKDYPSILPFYFFYRDQTNEIGEIIRSYEEENFKKRKKFFPHLSSSQIRIMFSLHLGIIASPKLSPEDVQEACVFLKADFK